MDHFSLFILHSSFNNCSKGKKYDKLSGFKANFRATIVVDIDY